VDRHDYAFPFRIDASSGQAARSAYPAHVDQMIRQILLTAPGERADLPDFGCGLRRQLFAPHNVALDATTQILVHEALDRWLGDQIEVRAVTVTPPEETGDEARLELEVDYLLIDTLEPRLARVTVA
jgi:phage baseplate assembly protein W